jgi:voltage-gated hydrogen channel 1
MLELLLSIFAFGIGTYFNSKFHVFDSIVIVASFVIDILLQGELEEVASLIIILRLFRVVKIVDELGAGAQEELDGLETRVRMLEEENERLKTELRRTARSQ